MENKVVRINPDYKGEPKPKKDEEDLVLKFKEIEEDESPADSKKFSHYESLEDLLEKNAKEAYNKSKKSISEEHYIRFYKLKRNLASLNLDSSENVPFTSHPELIGKTKEELEKILDRYPGKKAYSVPSLM